MRALFAADQFPHLFQGFTWGPVRYRFALCESPLPADLIGNVNMVPFVGERCLLIRLQSGGWDVPGGTLEPDESYLDTIRRELLEEAGARLVTFELLGAWHCHSFAPAPYRPHLPYPESYRLVGYGQVEVVGEPGNPVGAEQVAAVALVSVEEAARRFRSDGRPELAELYELAAAVRGQRFPPLAES